MRRAEILKWTEQLEQVFGPARPLVDTAPFRERYETKNYTGMLALVAKSMFLDMRLRAGYVNSGGINAPAWIQMPVVMPHYGSPAFKATVVTVYLRKKMLDTFRFSTILAVMAHELSHVLLNSVGHVARNQEEAVDLTAILFGYGEHFVSREGSYVDRAGYLTIDEIRFARAIMG